MLLCLYNLLTGSLVTVLRVQVLFLNRYALLLRRRCALYLVCLNDGWEWQRIRFKPNIERLFWVRLAAGGTILYMPKINDISNINIQTNNISDVCIFFLN